MTTKHDILTTNPMSAVEAEGVISFTKTLPDDAYDLAAATLYVAAHGTLLAYGNTTFTAAFGSGETIDVTYKRNTVIPAGSRVALGVPVSKHRPAALFIESPEAGVEERVNAIQRALIDAGHMAPPAAV